MAYSRGMNLDGLDVFVKVVQVGSFTGAAKALGMPVTTVSGKIANLEKRLGVTLIQRTTRKLHVTEAGEIFFNRCARALEEVLVAEQELTTKRLEPEGTLRITATIDVGYVFLPSLVKSYLKKYPKMKVDLKLTNRVVDLISESVDLAIRVGPLKDSTMIARKFLETHASLWASQGYVKKRGLPKHPRDLAKHEGIGFSSAFSDVLRLERDGDFRETEFPCRVSVDDMATMKAFVEQGDGIGLLPDFLCGEEERTGRFIKVLPDWKWSALNLSFVYPAQKFVPPKVQSFIEHALKSET